MIPSGTYVGPGELGRLLWGALRLRPDTYSEVARVAESWRLCAAIAVLGGAAYGIRLAVFSGLSPIVLAVDRILIVLGQTFFESAVVWLIGRALLRKALGFTQVFRPVALARAPQLFYLVLALLEAPAVAGVLVSVWLLAAFAVAIRAALQTGWIAAIVIVLMLGLAGELLSRTAPLLPT
jgi:hypothetical protein